MPYGPLMRDKNQKILPSFYYQVKIFTTKTQRKYNVKVIPLSTVNEIIARL